LTARKQTRRQQRRRQQHPRRQAVGHQHDAVGRGPVAELVDEVGAVGGRAEQGHGQRNQRQRGEHADAALQRQTAVAQRQQHDAGEQRQHHRQDGQMGEPVHRLPALIAVFVAAVDMVVAELGARLQRQHDDEGGHAEADDDGGEHQCLRQRVGVAGRGVADHRRHADGEPAHDEQEQVDGVGHQGEAQHHRKGLAAQREEHAARGEHADDESDQRLHQCFPLPVCGA
jgi:hypothetical protein